MKRAMCRKIRPHVGHGARFETYRPTFLLVDEDDRITREQLRAQTH